MANIPNVNPFTVAVGASPVTPIALGLSNTLEFRPSSKQVLFIRNGSGAAITATLDGADAPSTVPVPGAAASLNIAAGAAIVVGAGATVMVPLGSYRSYLVGAVTLAVSLATDVTAWLIEV